jgi:hypothetical protein
MAGKPGMPRSAEHIEKIRASNVATAERKRQERIAEQERLADLAARVRAAQEVMAEVESENMKLRLENARLRAQMAGVPDGRQATVA